MAKCWNCDKDVPQTGGKRLKLYCNEACRKAYKRKQKRTPIPDKSIPDTPEQAIPDTSGKCWCCGEDIGPGLVCCGPCAWSGKAKEKRAGQYPPLLTDRTPEQMERDLHSKELTGPIPVVIGKPGDPDYDGVCSPEPQFLKALFQEDD